MKMERLPPDPAPTIHPSAAVHPTAKIGRDVQVDPFAVIGAGAVVGDRCRIGNGVSIIIFLFSVLLVVPALSQQSSTPRAYLGFDRNDYPGDAALLALRRSFSFAGYWLGPPPGAKSNSWSGKRELVRSLGFGFLVLYSGPQSNELQQKWSEQHVFNNLKTRLSSARKRGASDARQATAAAKKEGFPSHTVIFLDIEEGGRLPAVYHAYLRSWVDQLERAGAAAPEVLGDAAARQTGADRAGRGGARAGRLHLGDGAGGEAGR